MCYVCYFGGGSSSVRGDLAWELEGRRSKSSLDHIWSVDWQLERCQFTSWAVPGRPWARHRTLNCPGCHPKRQPHHSDISPSPVCIITTEWKNWISHTGINEVCLLLLLLLLTLPCLVLIAVSSFFFVKNHLSFKCEEDLRWCKNLMFGYRCEAPFLHILILTVIKLKVLLKLTLASLYLYPLLCDWYWFNINKGNQ